MKFKYFILLVLNFVWQECVSQIDPFIYGKWSLDSVLIDDSRHLKIYYDTIEIGQNEYKEYILYSGDGDSRWEYNSRFHSGMNYIDHCHWPHFELKIVEKWKMRVNDSLIKLSRRIDVEQGFKYRGKSSRDEINYIINNGVLIFKQRPYKYYYHKVE